MTRRIDPATFCRASADTARHLEDQLDQYKRTFSVWDEDLFIDIAGGKLGPVVQDLLQRLEQIDKTNASFGADEKKALDFILPTLHRLRAVCEEEMEQI